MEGRIIRPEEVEWSEPPGHLGGAFSKLLVNESHGSRYFDFRISIYQPKAHVEPHAHEKNEQIFYILKGHGIFELDGKKHPVNAGTVIFIPPHVRHGITNSGFEDLIFIVVASPPKGVPE